MTEDHVISQCTNPLNERGLGTMYDVAVVSKHVISCCEIADVSLFLGGGGGEN